MHQFKEIREDLKLSIHHNIYSVYKDMKLNKKGDTRKYLPIFGMFKIMTTLRNQDTKSYYKENALHEFRVLHYILCV